MCDPRHLEESTCSSGRPLGRAVGGRWLVAALLLAHASMLAWGAARHSPTRDEVGHLIAGISHWRFGSFGLYRVNPPLVRMVAGIPMLLARPQTDWTHWHDGVGRRPELEMRKDFVAANGERVFRLYTLARWACIPFSLLGGYVCFRWARRLYGQLADRHQSTPSLRAAGLSLRLCLDKQGGAGGGPEAVEDRGACRRRVALVDREQPLGVSSQPVVLQRAGRRARPSARQQHEAVRLLSALQAGGHGGLFDLRLSRHARGGQPRPAGVRAARTGARRSAKKVSSHCGRIP